MAYCGTGTLGTRVGVTTLILCGFVFALPALTANADYSINTAPTGTPTDNNGWGRNAPAYELSAQSFTTSGAGDIGTITAAQLIKTGTPTDDVTASIQADSGGNPSGTPLGTSSAVDVQATTCGTEYTFTFSTPVAVSASTLYWVVFQRTSSTDSGNYYRNCDAGGYADGHKELKINGGAWDDFAPDDEKMIVNVTESAPSPSSSGATSTIEQVQSNIGAGFLTFFLGLLTMWLLFKRTE